MKNRTINTMTLTLHTMAYAIAAVLIVKLLWTIITVHSIGSSVGYKTESFGEKMSAVMVFFGGFFMYRRHTGLCASVNLAANKRVYSMVIAAVIPSLFIALTDIFMVKEYFTLIDNSNSALKLFWEKTFFTTYWQYSQSEALYNGLLIFKLTVFYHSLWIMGYIIRHNLTAKPVRTWIWLVLAFILITAAVSVEYIMMIVAVFLILMILACFIQDILFIFPAISLFCLGIAHVDFIIYFFMNISFILSTVNYISQNKYEIPSDKRRESTI